MESIMNQLTLVTPLFLALSTPAFAETTATEPPAAPATTSSRLHLDLEIDPTGTC